METKRFLDAAVDGQHVSRTIICKWNQRFNDGRTDIVNSYTIHQLPKKILDLAPMDFDLFLT